MTVEDTTPDHPVIAGARRVIYAKDGAYALDAEGAAALEALILAHAHDQGLPEALRTLFGLIVVLHDDLHSIDAARLLMMVLGRVQPHLSHLAPDFEAIHQKLGDRGAAIFGERPSNFEKLNGAPPPGAISVQSMKIPQMTPPSLARLKKEAKDHAKKATAGGRNR